MTISDTHPSAQAVHDRLLSRLPVWRKLNMLADLNQTARQIALEDLRERFPEASEADLRRHLAERLLGSEIAHMVYGPPVLKRLLHHYPRSNAAALGLDDLLDQALSEVA